MIGNDWDVILKDELKKEYFIKLMNNIRNEYNQKEVFPAKHQVFNAFRYTPYKNVKVVILGQDPYHGVGEAEGLSFSVPLNIKKPPSLVNIFQELHDDLGIPIPNHGSLHSWAKEGVLLLNAVLTVVKDHAASHQGMGWEIFTDNVIKLINEKDTPVVFILWGRYARSKKKLITNPIHYVVESAHPSPLSAYNGFFGSRPFSKTNNYLISKGLKPINWEIKNIEKNH